MVTPTSLIDSSLPRSRVVTAAFQRVQVHANTRCANDKALSQHDAHREYLVTGDWSCTSTSSLVLNGFQAIASKVAPAGRSRKPSRSRPHSLPPLISACELHCTDTRTGSDSLQQASMVGPLPFDWSPKVGFSIARRTTRAAVSGVVRGRPGRRVVEPSYFLATSLRYHRRMVSGVTMPAMSARAAPAENLAFHSQTAPLMIAPFGGRVHHEWPHRHHPTR